MPDQEVFASVDVMCPYCLSPSGSECRAQDGRERGPHAERVIFAARQPTARRS